MRNEVERIRSRCTDPDQAQQHLTNFSRILEANGYPNNTIQAVGTRTKKTRRQKISHTNNFFFHIPYISNRVHTAIGRIFQKEGLNVIPYSRNPNLRQLLKPQEIKTCSLNNCPLSQPQICTKKGVVYELKCNGCEKRYIGSTIRELHTRIKEHFSQSTSAVKLHLGVCRTTNGFSTRILTRDRDPKNLRIKEALLIADKKPELNRKEEQTQLASLVKIVIH